MWGKAFKAALSIALPAQKLVLPSSRLLAHLRTAPRSSLPPLIPQPSLFPPTIYTRLAISCKGKKKRKKSQCRIKPCEIKRKKCSKRVYKCPQVQCPVHLTRKQKDKKEMQRLLKKNFTDPWKGTKHERKKSDW